jgi:CheY-like chemotaxis protein
MTVLPGCILYIDDNADSRRLVQRVLASLGYDVQVAPDGRSGLQMAESLNPSVVLMDMNLPDMDGFTIATQLRARPEFAHVKLIALTAADVTERERALAAGCDLFMEKPLDLDRFMWYVDKWTGN